MAWKRSRRPFGRKPRGILFTFPPPYLMRTLGALAAGERLTLDGADRLVLTAKGDPGRGWPVPTEDLDDLCRRGWVELTPPCSAVVTAEGRKWVRLWMKHEMGLNPDKVRVDVAANTGGKRDG